MVRFTAFVAALLWAGLAQAAGEPQCRLATRASGAGLSQSLAFAGSGYRDFSADESSARLVVSGAAVAERLLYPAGPVSAVEITPLAAAPAGPAEYEVRVEFRETPQSSLVNHQPGEAGQAGRVTAGFTFAPARAARPRPLGGGRASRADAESAGAPGHYKLPPMPPAHYSDALVTLKVNGGDFREILWLMSEIGQVSIILDPYWYDEPTGSPRGVGGGVDGSIDPGGRGPGFRPGGGFDPRAPREGVGKLSLDFKEVPFDLALDLILQAVNLVKVDVYPEP